MTELREKFEALSEIENRVRKHEMQFCDKSNMYYSHGGSYITVAYVNGAWYAFQEQQKRIDEHNRKLNIFINELKKTHNDDKNNRIDYWRGFSECADSSVQVFLRDAGFID